MLSHRLSLSTGRGGVVLPALGQGTWRMGENDACAADEIAALRAGLRAGLTVIDTAACYGDGRAERLVGAALAPFPREGFFVVSKVPPRDATRAGLRKSCQSSLENLRVGYLDLYLLHWRDGESLPEVVEGMEGLVDQGLIRRWGVSNFDVDDMEELWSIPKGNRCAVNQVLYHLGSRGIEVDLLPWMTARKVPVMAYSPIAQAGEMSGELYTNSTVKTIAQNHHASVSQILLAFVIRGGNVIAIPKSSKPAHTMENAAADKIELTEEDLKALDAAFPPPKTKVPLDIV